MSDRDFVSIESPAEVLTTDERAFAFDVPAGDGVPVSGVASATTFTGTLVTGTVFSTTGCSVAGQRVTFPMAKNWTDGTSYKLDARVTMQNNEKLTYRIEVSCVG